MSSYHRIIISLVYLVNLSLFADDKIVEEKTNIANDIFAIIGLDREYNNDFSQSSVIYEKLFEKTNSSEYLQKTIDSYLRNQEFEKVIKLSQDNIDTHKDIKEYLLTQHILSLMLLKKYKEALPFAKQLEDKYTAPQSLGLIGDLYYVLGFYEDARKNYEKAYQTSQSTNIVLALSNVLYVKLNNQAKAINYLQDFVDINGCSEDVCTKLLEYYQKDNNITGMIKVVEKVYSEHKKNQDNDKLAKIELILSELYMQVDKQKGIDFLKDTGNNNLQLVLLYESNKEYDKALKLLNLMYSATNEKSLLGRIAMITFNLAKDKKTVITDVLANFELALSEKSNPEFENYYGYLLIDYDLDIKKGLELVKKAFSEQPNNIAFIDSLAWGYFKNNNCDMAYDYIEQVVQKVGFDNEEINFHYGEIKECKEKGIGNKYDFR